MQTSPALDAFAAAFADAQGELRNTGATSLASIPGKEGRTGFSYKYATLDQILDEIRPVLAKHGLAITQETAAVDNTVGVNTRLLHKSGQWIDYGPLFFPTSGDPRQSGSALTYARRYALTAALGITTTEDDDGAGAAKHTRARSVPAPTPALATRTGPLNDSETSPTTTTPTDAPASKELWDQAVALIGSKSEVIDWYRDAKHLTGTIGTKDLTTAAMEEIIALASESATAPA